MLNAQPHAMVWVIVSATRQAANFRKRLAQAGGALNVHVSTFGDL
jgi:hypothetical protein